MHYLTANDGCLLVFYLLTIKIMTAQKMFWKVLSIKKLIYTSFSFCMSREREKKLAIMSQAKQLTKLSCETILKDKDDSA